MEAAQNSQRGAAFQEIAAPQKQAAAVPLWINKSDITMAESVLLVVLRKADIQLTRSRKETPLKAVQVEGLVGNSPSRQS
jgi:hypothetical protein